MIHSELAEALRAQQRAIQSAIEILESGEPVKAEPATGETVKAAPCGRCAILEQEVKAAWTQAGEELARADALRRSLTNVEHIARSLGLRLEDARTEVEKWKSDHQAMSNELQGTRVSLDVRDMELSDYKRHLKTTLDQLESARNDLRATLDRETKLRKELKDCERALRDSPYRSYPDDDQIIKAAQSALAGKAPRLYTAEEIRPLVEALKFSQALLTHRGGGSQTVNDAIARSETLGL